MPAETQLIEEVGSRIRAQMGRRRVSMAALSRSTGIPRATLTNQIDHCGVTVLTLVRIAEALDADPAEFLPSRQPAKATA
ncbi:helix-turn-helix domain-containing protein [Mycolicibacterium goodii]|nr:helix-turn-helix transcriptional regulator [Mycolicibacterium goodii]MBU8832369.1 helix-turn-helix transcriptional regulator [Mycolicibacterium goodii]